MIEKLVNGWSFIPCFIIFARVKKKKKVVVFVVRFIFIALVASTIKFLVEHPFKGDKMTLWLAFNRSFFFLSLCSESDGRSFNDKHSSFYTFMDLFNVLC